MHNFFAHNLLAWFTSQPSNFYPASALFLSLLWSCFIYAAFNVHNRILRLPILSGLLYTAPSCYSKVLQGLVWDPCRMNGNMYLRLIRSALPSKGVNWLHINFVVLSKAAAPLCIIKVSSLLWITNHISYWVSRRVVLGRSKYCLLRPETTLLVTL